jgi:hypothetical protein
MPGVSIMPLDFTSAHPLPVETAISAILRDWRPLAETRRRRTHPLVAWFDGLLADGARASRAAIGQRVEA